MLLQVPELLLQGGFPSRDLLLMACIDLLLLLNLLPDRGIAVV